MEEKRKDLTSSKQKELIKQLLAKLHSENPSFYYFSTSDIAHEIIQYAAKPSTLSNEESMLMKGLSARDVQLILSLHSR